MWKLDSCGRAKVEAGKLVNGFVTILGKRWWGLDKNRCLGCEQWSDLVMW